MAYQKTNWVNDETPLNAENMNNIENGIEQNESDITNITNNTAQIQSEKGNLVVGGASTNCDYGVVIGNGASASHGGVQDNAPVVIGYKASVGNQTDGIAIGRSAKSNNGRGIAIGPSSTSSGSSVVIGNNAQADSSAKNKIAIGYYAKCYGNNAIQFANSGSSSADHTNIGEINFGGPWNSWTGGQSFKDITLYNDTVRNTAGYHKLAFDEEVCVLTGEIAPDTTIVGRIGQFYLDTVAKKLYQCTAINTETVDEVETTTYEWQAVSGGSGKYLHLLYLRYAYYGDLFLTVINNNSTSYKDDSMNDNALLTDLYNIYGNYGYFDLMGGNNYNGYVVVRGRTLNSVSQGISIIYMYVNKTTNTISIDGVNYDIITDAKLTEGNSTQSLTKSNIVTDTVIAL